MRVLGVKTSKLTNTRGFCAELSTAITVVVASRYGASSILDTASAYMSIVRMTNCC